jgi:hypothetical protein
MRRRLKPSSRSSFKRSQPHPLISNIRPVCAGGLGLLGREKPLLVLGDLIEPKLLLCAFAADTILQIS